MSFSLQTAPYDIRCEILYKLSLRDLYIVQGTCKALREPVADYPTNFYTKLAPTHFAELGWPELLRVLRTRQRLMTLRHFSELPFSLVCASDIVETAMSGVSDPQITKKDFQELLMLEKAVRLLSQIYWEEYSWTRPRYSIASNVLLLAAVLPESDECAPEPIRAYHYELFEESVSCVSQKFTSLRRLGTGYWDSKHRRQKYELHIRDQMRLSLIVSNLTVHLSSVVPKGQPHALREVEYDNFVKDLATVAMVRELLGDEEVESMYQLLEDCQKKSLRRLRTGLM